MKRFAFLFYFMIILLITTSCAVRKTEDYVYQDDSSSLDYTFQAFDTTCSIEIFGVHDLKKADDYEYSMERLIHAYEDVFSKTKLESEVYEINHRTENYVMVHEECARLFNLAKDFYTWSSGKFDISAGTLFNLWDVKNRKSLPSDDEIKEAMSHASNFDYVVEKVDSDESEKNYKITFNGDKLTQYDFGGLIKGYCCDELKRMLNENSDISACIVNLGGNVLVTGSLNNRKNGEFKVGIQKPFTTNETIDVVGARDKNVITSGNYQRYFKIDGDDRIYHHIIDPTSGYPTNNNLDSVTIVSDNGLLGDYLSTSCMLLGEEDSKPLIDFLIKTFGDKDLQAIFVRSDGTVSKYPIK